MKLKKTLLILSCLGVLGLAACTGDPSVSDSQSVSPSVSVSVDPTVVTGLVASLKSGTEFVVVGQTDTVEVTEVEPATAVAVGYTYASSNTAVATVDAVGVVTGLAKGDVTITVTETKSGVAKGVELSVVPKAEGGYNYVAKSAEERTNILGILEKYAVDEHLTGLSLYENGGYVMYNPRIQKGTENYISGYGFGILAEGKITADLASEDNAAWKQYYHTVDASDPGSINYLDSDGSQIADYYDTIQSSYWGTKMNAEKDGYDWYSVLAKEKPQAVNADPVTGLATKWKFRVKTGADGLVYNTASTKANVSGFAGRGVALEDYITAFKQLLCQKNALYRGNELQGNSKKAGGIVGADVYWKATAEGVSDTAFDSVGVKADASDNSLTFTLPVGATQFYAMYYLASSLYAPIPQTFLDAIGGMGNYGNFITEGAVTTATPVDTILSLAPYMLETWAPDQEIVFKRNPLWVEFGYTNGLEDRYSIPGIHYDILKAQATDNTATIKEFLADKIDAAGIPLTYLAAYKNDSRTSQTKGDNVFKLNMNTCDEETWAKMFGVNGTIAQTPESGYYAVKPWMANSDFVDGLSAAIDRGTYAANRGYVASNNYFSSNYMSDPENGISYNATAQHAAAVASHYPSTFGYNLEAAKVLFKRAVDTLVEDGKLELGTVAKPTEISINITWMYQSMIESNGTEVAGYITKAFNDSTVSGGKVHLTVTNTAVTTWTDVYYNVMMVGQFDLAFGSISGNSLNPLNFMEVLRSDNSSKFTLNWGTDTSVVTSKIVYDDTAWSFNGLWKAADSGAIFNDGVEVPAIVAHATSVAFDGTGATLNAVLAYVAQAAAFIEIQDITIYIIDVGELSIMEDAVIDEAASTITIATTFAGFAQYGVTAESYGDAWEFVIYYSATIAGVYSEAYLEVATLA